MENYQKVREDTHAKIEVIENDIRWIRESIIEIKANIEKKYITKEEFVPIRNLVYGVVGIVMTAFIYGLVTYFKGSGK